MSGKGMHKAMVSPPLNDDVFGPNDEIGHLSLSVSNSEFSEHPCKLLGEWCPTDSNMMENSPTLDFAFQLFEP